VRFAKPGVIIARKPGWIGTSSAAEFFLHWDWNTIFSKLEPQEPDKSGLHI